MIENKIKKNIPLLSFTTFKIGGCAKYFLKAKTYQDIIDSVKWAKHNHLPYFILGGGSNVLISDNGFPGLVLKPVFNKIKVLKQNNNKVELGVMSGVMLPDLIKYLLLNNLTGLEWAVGIPGTVGGAVRGNAGAYGHSISEFVKLVKILKNNSICKIKNKDIDFAYRRSNFQKNKYIILEIVFIFKKGLTTEYKEKIKQIIKRRKHTLPSGYSAGCVFKNIKFSKIPNKTIIKYPQIKEFKKNNTVPAGWVIDQCGLKGKKINKAQISTKHANFIININNAKARHVVELINLIKHNVLSKFGIELKQEIEYVGF